MSIIRDFTMYYSDTYVGYQDGSEMLPFYIINIEYCPELVREVEAEGRDLDDLTRELYADHDRVPDSLLFFGYTIDFTGHRVHRSVKMKDLILENPELGYIKSQNRWCWVTYRPNHSAKKGLTPRRLNNHDLSRSDIYKLFNIQPGGELLHRDVVLTPRNILCYKGVSLAHVVDGVLTLDKKFKVMKDYFLDILPETIELTFTE